MNIKFSLEKNRLYISNDIAVLQQATWKQIPLSG